MIITKKESKNLRYFARANYKSECKGVETENGKVKHREFPCFELSYDESKSADGLVELTNVTIGGKPFEGDYSALMTRLRVILDSPDDVCAEELEQDKTLTKQAMDTVKDKSDTIVIAEKPGDIIKETLKDCFPEGSEISVDVKPEENKIDAKVSVPNVVDHVDVQINVKPVEDPQEPEHLFGPMSHRGVVGDALQFFKDVKWVDRKPKADEVPEAPEKKTIVVTGPAFPETHDSGRDYSGLSNEAIAEAYNFLDGENIGTMKPSVEPPALEEAPVAESLDHLATHEPPPLEVAPLEEPQEPPVVENVEEAKQVVEETGKPVITAVQKPKKTRAELYDLQIKCATMKLATSYKEPPDTDIGWLMKKYPDAVEKLNALYAADGIKTYTITEEAIKKAYPDEYAVLCP